MPRYHFPMPCLGSTARCTYRVSGIPPKLTRITLLMLALFCLASTHTKAQPSTLSPAAAIAENPNRDSLSICVEPAQLNSGFNAALGQASDVIRSATVAAAQGIGLQVKFVELPWLRCLFMVKNNRLDGLIASVWQIERSEWMQYPLTAEGKPDFNRRAWLSQYSIFVAKDSQLQWDGVQFSGLKNGIGSPLGYQIASQLKLLGVLNKHIKNTEDGLKLVARGLLDGFVTEQTIGESHLEVLDLEGQIERLPELFSQQDVFVPLSRQFYRNNPLQAEKFFDLVADYYKEARPHL